MWALDLDDWHLGNRCLEVWHRPETETPIKNQEDGERMVAPSKEVCDLLDDWTLEKETEEGNMAAV